MTELFGNHDILQLTHQIRLIHCREEKKSIYNNSLNKSKTKASNWKSYQRNHLSLYRSWINANFFNLCTEEIVKSYKIKEPLFFNFELIFWNYESIAHGLTNLLMK